MKQILVGCLLLMGCESAELTAGGMRVRAINDAPGGCRLVATVREKEGGGLRSFSENRHLVDTRLRNEAARLGGNALAVVEEARGDTDDGLLHFQTGVPGIATPNPRCTNCVAVTAHVFQCAGAGPLVTPEAPPASPACPPGEAGRVAPPVTPVPAEPPAQVED